MKRYAVVTLFFVMVLLTGCGQKEAEVKNQITIASYDDANTASEYVKRGDLAHFYKIKEKIENTSRDMFYYRPDIKG